MYPQKLKDIAGKELMFNVIITDNNVTLKSQIFEVTDAYVSNPTMASTSQTTNAGISVSNFSAVRT